MAELAEMPELPSSPLISVFCGAFGAATLFSVPVFSPVQKMPIKDPIIRPAMSMAATQMTSVIMGLLFLVSGNGV